MSLGILDGDFLSVENWDGLAISSPDVQSIVSLQYFFDDNLQLYVLHESREAQDLIYIGETKGRIRRPIEGRRFVSRDMASPSAILFFSRNPMREKKLLRYIEGRMYFALRRYTRMKICNSALPLSARQDLSSDEIRNCERYLNGIWEVLVHLQILDRSFLQTWILSPHHQYELRLEANGRELYADGKMTQTGFVVHEGSAARLPKSPLLDDRYRTRRQLIDEGVLERVSTDHHLRFSRDFEFSSAYAAACLVSGGNTSARRWVRRGTGHPLTA